jgi:hypothetical protein
MDSRRGSFVSPRTIFIFDSIVFLYSISYLSSLHYLRSEEGCLAAIEFRPAIEG